jgi:hypothetical protein
VTTVPEVRTRRQYAEARRDEEMLRWISRFRFVTAAILGERFSVSARMCRERLARLQSARLVMSHQAHPAAAKLYAIGPAGRFALGLRHRRPPRWDTQVTHELAIGSLVAQLELARPELAVLTERDCRRREAQGSERYSVSCVRDGAPVRRWPDVVIEGDGKRVAVEIELAPKTTKRLTAIFLGYLTDARYERVQVRCGSNALTARVRRVAQHLGAPALIVISLHSPEMRSRRPD